MSKLNYLTEVTIFTLPLLLKQIKKQLKLTFSRQLENRESPLFIHLGPSDFSWRKEWSLLIKSVELRGQHIYYGLNVVE